jgi:cell division protein FtsB
MAVKKKQMKKNVLRLKAQTTFVRFTNGLLFSVLLIVGAIGIGVTYWPQKNLYQKKQGELAEAREREEMAESRLDSLRIKLDAIKNDPAYLEIQARDRLPVYRPGETIFRIEK